MKKLILLFAVILLTACSKEETFTIDGIYQVQTKDSNNNAYTGLITISGTNLTLDGFAWGHRTGTIARGTNDFTVIPDNAFRSGNAQINGDQIIGVFKIYYNSGHNHDVITFNGFRN